MDNRWGKYDSPLAALTERWVLDGDFGDEEFSNSDLGEGTILWKAPIVLSYADARYLSTEFDCTEEELGALDRELSMAQAVVHGWDSQGFIYGGTLDTVAERDEAIAKIEALNAEYAEQDA